MGFIDPIDNMLELRQWFGFAPVMPDSVLLELLQPYIPVEPLDRSGRNAVVVLYCEHAAAERIRRTLNEWSERYEREEWKRRSAEMRARFEEWIKTQGLSPATELPPSDYD